MKSSSVHASVGGKNDTNNNKTTSYLAHLQRTFRALEGTAVIPR